MSSSDSYWKTLNSMLESDNIEFNLPVTMGNDLRLCCLTFEETESLKTGIQYALNNFEVISKLEYELNDGQPAKVTHKQLEWAKVFIDKSESTYETCDYNILNAQHYVPIGEFLLNCHIFAQRQPSKFKILTDDKRKVLICNLFGTEYSEEARVMPELKSNDRSVTCSQVIFDTADIASAIDELIFNQIDRTWSPWRIQSVYIQESLRNDVENLLTQERLNAKCSTIKSKLSEDYPEKNQELAKKYGGRILSSDNETVHFLFDVPPKYFPQSTDKSFAHIPVSVNYFRTAKEAIQLLNADLGASKKHITSIWTGDIQLFYEAAIGLNAKIVWSNAVGVFDAMMPSLIDELDSKKTIRLVDII